MSRTKLQVFSMLSGIIYPIFLPILTAIVTLFGRPKRYTHTVEGRRSGFANGCRFQADKYGTSISRLIILWLLPGKFAGHRYVGCRAHCFEG